MFKCNQPINASCEIVHLIKRHGDLKFNKIMFLFSSNPLSIINFLVVYIIALKSKAVQTQRVENLKLSAGAEIRKLIHFIPIEVALGHVIMHKPFNYFASMNGKG